MGAPRTIYIAGAGVAGLTLALALAKFGLRVVVIERATEPSASGAGLQLSANARRELDRLGLAPHLVPASLEPEGIDVYSGRRADPIQTLELGETIAQRFGARYAVMHRADLTGSLHAALKRFANVEIVFGVSAFRVERDGPGVAVSFNEPDGKTRQAKAFVFIGADGVGSATRQTILGGPPARYAGVVAWRALVDAQKVPARLAAARTSLFMGSRYHGVVYPLPHRDAVNAVLFTPHPQARLPQITQRTAPALPPRLHPSLAGIVKVTPEEWTPWVLSCVTIPQWHDGPIGLIGDAAHAMLPFQAQGAAMAIEDAATLAPLLASAPNATHALSRFSALRQPRVERVQKLSQKNGRIFHMRWPLSLARDAVIRLQGPRGHLDRLDWLYRFDTQDTAS